MKRSTGRKLIGTTKGVTLIELMVVVAIIGILAMLGSIAYKRYINSAHITRMETVAAEVWGKQKLYAGERDRYFNPGGDFATETTAYQNLLQFNGPLPHPEMELLTEGWEPGGTCTSCGTVGVSPDTAKAGFIVIVSQSLNPDSGGQTTVIMRDTNEQTVLINEGD